MLGIDVDSKKLVCTLVDPTSREPVWRQEFLNTPTDIQALLQKTPADAAWVVEPTGRYSLPVAKSALRAGRQVLMAPPRKAKAFLASIQARAKTDKIDSKGLALFGLAVPLRPYPIKSAFVEQIDQLLSTRKLLSRSLASQQLLSRELAHSRDFLAPVLSALKQQIAALDKQVHALLLGSEMKTVYKNLLEVPGIGKVTAAALTSRLSAKQFTHPDQFIAYLGLDIGVRQSGQSRGETGLTKQGDAELRRLLYLAAQANLRCKASPFRTQYGREKAKGLGHKAALCAVARKLARLCWSLHKHQTRYDAARVGVQPTTASSPPEDIAAVGA